MSENNEQNVYFTKLNSQEIESKISQLLRLKKSQITVWIKGNNQKHHLSLISYIREKNQLLLGAELPNELNQKELLFSFDLKGLHFFGKCRYVFKYGKQNLLELTEDVFKSERRNNFRLLTYPHKEVYLYLKPRKDAILAQNSNLVDFQTGVSEEHLFKNFLKMVESDKDKKFGADHLKLRVLDISATGIAILIGDLERKMLRDIGTDLSVMYLDFNGEVIAIPNGKILYKRDFSGKEINIALEKAGIQFSGVDTYLDQELSRKINQSLSSLDSEFEDFLK